MNKDQPITIVSNRLPVACAQQPDGSWTCSSSSGGLVTALTPVLEQRGHAWIGWPGVAIGDTAGLTASLKRVTEDMGFDVVPVPLSKKAVDGFYHGFSNEVLWPLFHDMHCVCHFKPAYWSSFREVNRRFAGVVAKHTPQDDFIWVQDYHLIGLAAELRALGMSNTMGHFLHIPFPPADTFMKLPWRRELLEGLLGFDLVGLQTPRDRDNFLGCLAALGLGEVEAHAEDGWSVRSRTGGAWRRTRVDAFPISIDYRQFAERATSVETEQRMKELRTAYTGRKLALGVDRLDPSKGLEHKIAGFARALERFAELRGRLTLVQHVVPSREQVPEYQRLHGEVERLCGEINGRFGRPDWMPVHYFYHVLSPDQLAAYYRLADIALVTPLKDGMNLVAKEYCASNVDLDGVLVLSEFAGAAAELGHHSLLVNPFDVEGMASAIRAAYTMPPKERAERMRGLRRQLCESDVFHWADKFLHAASLARPGETSRGPGPAKRTPRLNRSPALT